MQTKSPIKQFLPLIILLSSLLTGTVACKKDKDKDGTVPPPANAALLQEYTNGDQFIRFDYNTDGSIKKVSVKDETSTGGNAVDYNITYNAQKKISQVTTSAGETIVPVYENGTMIRADVFEGDEKTGYTNYHFQNNLLQRATLYWYSEGESIPFFEFDYEYNNAGNVIETVFMVATGVPGEMTRAGHIEYQHDDKVNPQNNVPKEVLALFWHAASKNNVKQEDHFDADLVAEDRYVYTYTYKPNGLPQGGEVKIGLPNQPQTTAQIAFTYK